MPFSLLQVIFWIGVTDAMALMLLGVSAALLTLLQGDAPWFWDRMFPAIGYLVATSFAAGVVMAITRWLTGIA